jgi:transposase
MVYIEAEANRVCCEEHGVVVQQFPWARHKSRFTKNFEDLAAWLSLHLSRKAIAEYLRISWDTVGPIITRVEKELSSNRDKYDNLENIAIDETSYKKGHKYITLILNHDTNAVVWAGKGYGKAVLESFFTQLSKEQCQSIRLVSGDGAKWIKNTVQEYCPNAKFCIDPFHVVSWVQKYWTEFVRKNGTKPESSLQTRRKTKQNEGGDDPKAVMLKSQSQRNR